MTAKEYGVLIPKESGTDFYFYYGRNTQSEEGSLSDLPSGYIWLAAHKPEHINSGIEIRSNGWLIKTMEMLVAEMGYRLPSDGLAGKTLRSNVFATLSARHAGSPKHYPAEFQSF